MAGSPPPSPKKGPNSTHSPCSRHTTQYQNSHPRHSKPQIIRNGSTSSKLLSVGSISKDILMAQPYHPAPMLSNGARSTTFFNSGSMPPSLTISPISFSPHLPRPMILGSPLKISSWITNVLEPCNSRNCFAIL